MNRTSDIHNRMRFLGASNFVLSKKETNALPKILTVDEEIQSYIFGTSASGLALMVATNKRLIFVDKFMFDLKVDEVYYDSISCIEYDLKLFSSTIKVYTQAKDFVFTKIPKRTAINFVNHVEYKIEEMKSKRFFN